MVFESCAAVLHVLFISCILLHRREWTPYVHALFIEHSLFVRFVTVQWFHDYIILYHTSWICIVWSF